MPTRSRKEHKVYKNYLKKLPKDVCQFCLIDQSTPQFIKETKHFKIVQNIFPYSMWDMQSVADHLMIIPKQHTDTLSDLTAEQALEFTHLLADYEKQGYNVYARTPGSGIKSVVHQHTHLIKPGKKTRKFIFYLAKPYLRFGR